MQVQKTALQQKVSQLYALNRCNFIQSEDDLLMRFVLGDSFENAALDDKQKTEKCTSRSFLDMMNENQITGRLDLVHQEFFNGKFGYRRLPI